MKRTSLEVNQFYSESLFDKKGFSEKRHKPFFLLKLLFQRSFDSSPITKKQRKAY
jgi:hypothetical protein